MASDLAITLAQFSEARVITTDEEPSTHILAIR